MWAKLEEAIRSVVLLKEPFIVRLLKNYSSKRNFFEMVRFDFALDENMNVFIMEVRISFKIRCIFTKIDISWLTQSLKPTKTDANQWKAQFGIEAN